MVDEYRVVFSRHRHQITRHTHHGFARLMRFGLPCVCLGILICFLLFLGIGCTPKTSVPADQILFSPGDHLTLQPNFFGVSLLNLASDHATQVTITSFTSSSASLIWKKTIVTQLQSSSTIDFQKTDVNGKIEDLDLTTSTALLIPSWWSYRDIDPHARSGIWLSQIAYAGLTSGHEFPLDPGLSDSFIQTIIKTVAQAEVFIESLKGTSTVPIQPSGNVLRTDGEVINWPLTINEKKVTVPAIRAKSERMSLVILNNRDNPLILDLTLNPFAKDTLLSQGDWISHAEGFQVESLNVSGYK